MVDTQVHNKNGKVEGNDLSREILTEVLETQTTCERVLGYLLEALVWSILQDITRQCPWLDIDWIGVDSYLGIQTKHRWDFEIFNRLTGSLVRIDCCNSSGNYYASEYKGRREHPCDVQIFGKLIKGDSILDRWTGRAFEYQCQLTKFGLYSGTGFERRLRAFLWEKLTTPYPNDIASIASATIFPLPDNLAMEAEPLPPTGFGRDWGGTTTETDSQNHDTLLGGDSV